MTYYEIDALRWVAANWPLLTYYERTELLCMAKRGQDRMLEHPFRKAGYAGCG